ncbi:LEF-6 [Mythimna sequax nucleopolyhedrovirus]|nr:LEF-6 [Mythimna sequax nucleopolyhedrovirus]
MYVFYINGGNVEKRFSREFINFICGGKIKHDIKADQCTRKRCVVSSRYAADKLLAASHRAYWPDGSKFKCKLVHREAKRRRSNTPLPQKCHVRSVKCRAPSIELEDNDNWYTSTSFIDIHHDDDDNTLESLHRDLHDLTNEKL